MAHVAELPGCHSTGSTASKAVGATPQAIARFLVWLKGHREPLVPEAHVSRPTMADLFVAEVRSGGAPTTHGSHAAVFPFDEEPWTDEKLERTLRWLSYSRTDLLTKVAGLDRKKMESREVAPGRTLWDTLWHIADAEYGYVNRIAGPLEHVEPLTDHEPADVRARLALARDILVRRVRAIPFDRRGEIIYPTWASRPDEPWTVQKTLRRALEHELEHLAEW